MKPASYFGLNDSTQQFKVNERRYVFWLTLSTFATFVQEIR